MWYRIMVIREWFGEMSQRWSLIRDFNNTAKKYFITGNAPTLLEAKITIGDSNYRHAFSKWLGGGFRIKAMTGRPLNESELIEIGRVVLDNEELTRQLVALGWDTLEVHANTGNKGVKWALKDFVNMGGYINN